MKDKHAEAAAEALEWEEAMDFDVTAGEGCRDAKITHPERLKPLVELLQQSLAIATDNPMAIEALYVGIPKALTA